MWEEDSGRVEQLVGRRGCHFVYLYLADEISNKLHHERDKALFYEGPGLGLFCFLRRKTRVLQQDRRLARSKFDNHHHSRDAS